MLLLFDMPSIATGGHFQGLSSRLGDFPIDLLDRGNRAAGGQRRLRGRPDSCDSVSYTTLVLDSLRLIPIPSRIEQQPSGSVDDLYQAVVGIVELGNKNSSCRFEWLPRIPNALAQSSQRIWLE